MASSAAKQSCSETASEAALVAWAVGSLSKACCTDLSYHENTSLSVFASLARHYLENQ